MNSTKIAFIMALFPVLLLSAERVSAFYDPGVQRWLNRDPLGDIASLPVMTAGLAPWNEDDGGAETSESELQAAWVQLNQNLYRTMGNNPLNIIDLFGLADCEAGLGPGSLNPENLTALDMRTAGEIAKAKLKRTTLDAIQKSKVFGNGLKGSRSIDVNKLKQALNRDQLQQAKEIAQNAVRAAKGRLKQAATEKARQKELDFMETQLNRARACKQALAP